MPKRSTSQNRAPLNVVGHAIFENEPTLEEKAVVVSASSTTYSPVINTHLAHPESPYVIRFEIEEEVAESPVAATNFLTAEELVHTPTHEELHADDLIVSSLEALVQSSEDVITFPEVSRVARTKAAHPVYDVISVDDFIDQIEVDAPTASELEEELDAPLLTLDDLIDDIAVAEELADMPAEETPKRVQARKSIPKTRLVRVPAKKHRRTLQVGWAKTLTVFVGLSFAIVLPIHAVTTLNDVGRAQGSIMESGMSALGSLENAATAAATQNFGEATNAFDRAASSFADAQDELTSANRQLLGIAELIPSTGKQVKDGRLLLRAGEATSRAAATLTDGMATIANRTTASPAAAISLFDVFAEQAIPDLHLASIALEDINISSIPVQNRATVREIKEILGKVSASLETFHESSDAIQALLGHRQRQRYLVLFQNNTELRPTGGFWGSLAEIDILDGELQGISIPGGGTYDQQGQLQKQVQAPGPLQLLRGRWELQDANWFPDFPTSAEKAMWFYEQGGGPSVDGVIAINATLVAQLIDITGPIELPEYGMTIDGENFMFQTQKQVEVDYDKEVNQPKSFIGDLAPPLLEKITSAEGEDFLAIAQLFSQALSERDIQIYHTDSEIQSALSKLGWDGAMLGNTGDYLMVSHTNIGGGKTDGVIDDIINVESSMRSDGRIENLVTIERAHHGLASATFSGANNVSFTRVFVPRGSELLSVTGANPPAAELFESVEGIPVDADLERIENSWVDENTGTMISEGLGKTSFGHWLQTKPGTSSTLTFRYLLPTDILDEPENETLAQLGSYIGIPKTVRHNMVIQAQSGVDYRETHYKFNSGSLRPLWSTAETVSQFHMNENTDGFFGMILERP
ncbi:DUF4012 domain-containing protein [Candidatus Uhrbacteria bacterium]|jgi:hypothetical protein|nr:DUF4012 domain-containing protein [Candidatus Uhrbacteria bacterium]